MILRSRIGLIYRPGAPSGYEDLGAQAIEAVKKSINLNLMKLIEKKGELKS